VICFNGVNLAAVCSCMACVVKIVVVSVLTVSSSVTRVELMSDRAMSAAVKVTFLFFVSEAPCYY